MLCAMVGGLSDETMLARWAENPCGVVCYGGRFKRRNDVGALGTMLVHGAENPFGRLFSPGWLSRYGLGLTALWLSGFGRHEPFG